METVIEQKPVPRKTPRTTLLLFILFLIVAVFIGGPEYVKARSTAAPNICINHLRQIDGAKTSWALERSARKGEPVNEAQVIKYMRGKPVCPAGGTYTFGAVGEDPTCSFPGHVIYPDAQSKRPEKAIR